MRLPPEVENWPVAEPGDLVKSKDQLFYPHESLILAGYEPSEFLLVRIGGHLFELQGHVGRDAVHPAEGYWWVQEVVVA